MRDYDCCTCIDRCPDVYELTLKRIRKQIFLPFTCGKVMFSQASVILSTGGTPPPGRHHPSWADTTPPPQETATLADGTHPTGMHSCSLKMNNKLNLIRIHLEVTFYFLSGSRHKFLHSLIYLNFNYFNITGFPLGLENLENLEKWEGIFQSGKVREF